MDRKTFLTEYVRKMQQHLREHGSIATARRLCKMVTESQIAVDHHCSREEDGDETTDLGLCDYDFTPLEMVQILARLLEPLTN